MTRTLIGLDHEGVACVKVTKGSLDPVTTPDSNVGAFLYNSKLAADVKMTSITTIEYSGTLKYLPDGSNRDTYTAAIIFGGSTASTEYVTGAHVGSLYTLPLYDVKATRKDNGRYIGGVVYDHYVGYQERGGNWVTIAAYTGSGWRASATFNNSNLRTMADAIGISAFSSAQGDAMRYPDRKLVVWRLPGDETAIIDGAPLSPVAGQRTVEINSTACRVAKPGYDVRTATATQLAFDSGSNPIKIIAAADIAVPAGESYYDTGLTLPDSVLADVHFYVGSTIYYPANPVDYRLGAEYWFSGSRIYFQNNYVACRARFIVYAYDETPQTSGANDVLRQFTVNGENVVQFLRPGAGASPAFADIVLDSRWPSMRMLAEGYIPVTANGEQTYTVNFDGSGVWPMVKYMTVHPGGSQSSGAISWSKEVRLPYVNTVGLAYGSPGWTKWQGGDSTYCMLGASSATFKTFRGASIQARFSNANDFPNSPSHTYDPAPIAGIRYFILGIPA